MGEAVWRKSSSSSCFSLRILMLGPFPLRIWVLGFLFLTILQIRLVASVPASLKIGGLLAMNTSIGNLAFRAMQLAVEDVNADKSLLNGTVLEFNVYDTNCSAFRGAAAAVALMEQDTIAISGPQTSSASHFVAHLASATHVPLLSFSATDPTLSEYQYSYFLRLALSDRIQMEAVASLIGFFGWREVVAIYTDDDLGANGIDTLEAAITNVGATIVHREALDPSITENDMSNRLAGIGQMGSRIYVVHVQPSMSKILFTEAYYLRMMASGYVWIVTEAVTSILDMIYMNDQLLDATEGIIGLRTYVPFSPQLALFKNRWRQLMQNENQDLADAQLHSYILNAYDSIWMIAHAIDSLVRRGSNFTFEAPSYSFPSNAGGSSELARLKTLKEGPTLLQTLLSMKLTGLTGNIRLDQKGDRIGSAFQIVNMARGLRVVGYWSNNTGFSIDTPKGTSGYSVNASNLKDIIWPGGKTKVPRGWLFPKSGKPLVIGVPHKNGYKEFVDATLGSDNTLVFHGFCIDVFEAALSLLPYTVPYTFQFFGNGNTTPSYDELIAKIVNKDFDAVVGDVAITTKRARMVDFTQPYTTSGMVVVVPLRKSGSGHAWAFMRPFTAAMWLTTGCFFIFTAIVIWLLEHKKNRDFRGRPKKQIVTTLWFSFSTLFFAHREDVKSTLGRAVLVIWLFVVLIITSSYTASLTSILTVQQLTPSIQNIAGLIASNIPIGYQTGSFVEEYLLQLNVAQDRLVPLDSLAAYAAALKKGPKNGGVGAIVDELPYVQLFLSSECEFTMAGQAFTKSGWGFAFPKGSQLAIDISTAILTLAENGELQRVHDAWLNGYECSTQNVEVESNELSLSTFWGLFLITGTTSILCLLAYYIKMLSHFRRFGQREPLAPSMSNLSKGASFVRSFFSFVEQAQSPHHSNRGSSFSEKQNDQTLEVSNQGNGRGTPSL